ncbi:carboxypeptidase S [Phanerochaete sordida]|uniref:Carboxypeptidase S n=1 Tax=Phanerochaete sordida TaxID=48140 RepID=A0A9P3LDY4_9APHY|nr:carboxypeptidase S [Phanerochaete sordida]
MRNWATLASQLALIALAGSATASPRQFPLGLSADPAHGSAKDYCPQFAPLYPKTHQDIDRTLEDVYRTDVFLRQVVDAMGAVVRVPTESYDDFGPVGQDPRWQSFVTFHAELERLFPEVYKNLRVTKVNTHALVFHWQGSNDTLSPVLLTAHMDVVPIEPSTLDLWVHPPYSGFYDGTWLWGRGSCDDKPDVVSILTTVTSLLEQGFKPRRSFVLAFGIDEESAGYHGAWHIGRYLEETYGRNAFAAILDEGLPYSARYGGEVLFANPCTAEKGYLDLRVEISTLGGHSSLPPAHTAIGMLASAIIELEAHPHKTTLSREGTAFQELQCAALYGPEVPDKIRKLAKAAIASDDALEDLEAAFLKWQPLAVAQISTTQAVDLISGGVKVNALPELTTAIVNHRIAEHSSVHELETRITKVLKPVAQRFNLTLEAFGKNVTVGGAGRLTLSDAFGTALEPAPVTPTGHSPPYALLAGTVVSTVRSKFGHDAPKVVVQPALALGNTDTKHYWNLTKHIFRYSHSPADAYYNGAHTINEAIKPTAVVEKISFHTKFILNWDEADI